MRYTLIIRLHFVASRLLLKAFHVYASEHYHTRLYASLCDRARPTKISPNLVPLKLKWN